LELTTQATTQVSPLTRRPLSQELPSD